jgi:catechol 2,3-dioxygenase-like lactoylglutathione lyase family enzyme
MNALTTLTLAGALALTAIAGATANQSTQAKEQASMELGVFSVSLAVKDIQASKAFYEKLDFKEVGGVLEQNWVVLQNGTTTIGLFQGMFEGNILTFNPGWTKDKQALPDFLDVRELQALLKERGVTMVTEADESTDGPASFVTADPDGNTIYFDQHVPRPTR